MASTETLSVRHDKNSGKVTVTYGGRIVTIPGKYETYDTAQAAAENYARRYMGYK